MAKYLAMVTWIQTIERSVEIEVSAKDEEAAIEKAESKVNKIMEEKGSDKLLKAFDWEDTLGGDDTFSATAEQND